MFVPDEEAARLIEAFAAAAAPGLAQDAWPGWDPAGEPVGILLPDGSGICVLRLGDDLGRPVAARGTGEVPGLRHLGRSELAEPIPAPPGADAGLPGGARAQALTVNGRRVTVLAAERPSAPAMAAVLHRALFEGWWAGRCPAERPAEAELPEAEPAGAALACVEGRLLLEAVRARWALPPGHAAPPPPAAPAGAPSAAAAAELLRLAYLVALVRRERRAPLADEAGDLERWWETVAGVPTYVGLACARRLAPEAGPPAELAENLEWLGHLPPEARGAAAGCALAALLDALGRAGARPRRPYGGGGGHAPGDWRQALAQGTAAHLDAVLEAHLAFDGGPRDDAALEGALRRQGYEALVRAERRRLEEARRARAALVEAILSGPGTLVTCDVGALGAPEVASARPPEAVNRGMDLYAAGAAFRYPSGAVVAVDDAPLAHDRRSGLLQTRVQVRLSFQGDGAGIDVGSGLAFDGGLTLRAGGLFIAAGAGEVRAVEGGYLFRLWR